MNAVGDILEGKSTFSDLATPVKREVHYVNAGSFEDSIEWLEGITDPDTVFMALTYRGELPYFIYPTKIQLERIALRMASKGKRTLIAALPEAWTQSSQFFKGIEIGVLGNYLEYIRNQQTVSEDIAPLHRPMEDELAQIKDIETLLQRVEAFIQGPWSAIGRSSEPGEVTRLVDRLFKEMRSDGSFPDLRKSVEIISRFVREASGWLVVREFLHKRAFDPGDVRQIYYSDLMGLTEIKKAPKRPDKTTERIEISEEWYRYGRDEISETLSMYGDNFLFVDEVIMEAGPFHEGFMGFGRFTVPSPDDNPILKDHFVGLPLFGGHLQMEMAGQVGTFMVRKLTEAHGLMPILTGSSFPALNTMAPPGETLKVRISVSLPEKRNLTAEALIENQFATSKGKIRGMLVAERVLRKMLRSFDTER
jgi:3-hydroxymyristoyl/3-hydroxydecanoyl-(acyl carrier protein) dehydratase